MSYNNPWIYQGKPFTDQDIGKNYGFVYIITDLETNKRYIGKKFFWSIRKVKGKTRRQRFESDWKKYYSSSDVLKQLVKQHGEQRFKREIIGLFETKGQVNYNEVKAQFKHDVLEALMENGERAFYNDNIASRYFAARINDNEQQSQ